ncbi:MAG TPA: 3-oxoacyl-ACP reductase family protein [Gaiellales bacterium]|nr:3-oxoacyl-ACP reductase family protein [Gaiellales bacterium]
MSELAGQVAIVTGGGRGIGRAICERLAGEGCALVVNYHASRRAADELAAAIRAGAGQAVAVGGSIADPATGPSLAAAALEQFGRIDILVNNAGITRDVTVRKMSDADFTEIIETNLVGTHRVTKAVLDHLCEAGHGRIVTIASFVAQLGNYGQANYAASKGGLISWTKTLAYEVARFGVTVNCVCPGFIDTDMLRGVPDHIRERLLARVPLGRFGDPDEIARGVVYLVRDGAYITGTCLDVNGGLYM